jgi:predicted transcriptional regulator
LSVNELSELSAAQREIIEILWQHDREMTASEVRAVLGERREVSRNTVRTLLERMEQKGWLTHREENRAYLYRAACRRERSMAQQVGAVLEKVCGGSPETMVSALIDYRSLTAKEIERVKSLLNAARSKRGRRG